MAERAPRSSDYDACAAEYAASVAGREQGRIEGDDLGILPTMLDLPGDVRGLQVLDAGCGEGYLARVLALVYSGRA